MTLTIHNQSNHALIPKKHIRVKTSANRRLKAEFIDSANQDEVREVRPYDEVNLLVEFDQNGSFSDVSSFVEVVVDNHELARAIVLDR